MKNRSIACSLALAVLLAACGGGGGGSATGILSLTATDAPIDHSMVEEALIRVDLVRAHSSASGESGFKEIYDGDPIELDLLDLRNGVVQELGEAEVPAGDYRQVRLRVASAELRLTNGREYSTSDGSLHLTSQGTSGFKVFIDPPVRVLGGARTELLLDIDLTKTFLPVPADDPMNADSFQLHPVIRAANVAETGEVRGLVLAEDPPGAPTPVADATVYLLLPGEPDPANHVASTVTETDGAYAFLGVQPGHYDVAATGGGLAGRTDAVEVAAGNVSIVDVVLE